jgi:CheY-like chemotaxis protein
LANDKIVDKDSNFHNDSIGKEDLFQIDNEITFHSSGTFCVCFVSLVNPMESINRIENANNSSGTKYYYTVFLNSMADIAQEFKAKIIKSVGDGLLWYFPCTSSSDSRNEAAFKRVFDCAEKMIQARAKINILLQRKLSLPALNYRISADYGLLEIATSKSLGMTNDFFGPIMNTCNKINSLAAANGFVIGEAFYKVIKDFPFLHSNKNHYEFVQVKLDDNENSSNRRYYSPSSLKETYQVFNILFKYRNAKTEILDDRFKKILKEKEMATSTIIRDKTFDNCGSKEIVCSNFVRSETVRNEKLNKLQDHSNTNDLPVYQTYSKFNTPVNSALPSTLQEQRRTVNIMIVDDEPDILLVLNEFLKEENKTNDNNNKQQKSIEETATTSATSRSSFLNFNIDTFSDSNKALNKFAMVESNHHSFYDLVILDVRMTGINGLQLYQRFKNINDKTKIVFLTALDAVEEIATIFPELTRENILQKPISNTEFIRRIKRVIKG